MASSAIFTSITTQDLPKTKILLGTAPYTAAPAAPLSASTLPQLFESQAKQRPLQIAFSCEQSDGLKTVTYAEADAIAASLAIQVTQLILESSPRNGQAPVVAIWLEKGLDLILSILATTYSGATWLPFDPDVPLERAAVCVLDARASVVICDAAHHERALQLGETVAPVLAAEGRPLLRISSFDDLYHRSEGANGASAEIKKCRPSGPSPRDAAYLIYTSGTTGTPKGIAIPHSAALVFSLSEREVLHTSPNDIVWNGFSPAFDMFVEEMWVTIAGGGHLAIGTREECRDVGSLPTIWQNRRVSIVNAVPTLIGIMDIAQGEDEGHLLPQCIRLINLGGEACPPALVKRLARPGLRIVNTYGPTETTVTATWDELQPDVPVTIGRPLPSYHACLLPIAEDGGSASLEPLELEEGVEGELAIGGSCVGLGYVNREELTAQKFIRHPLAHGSRDRLYRTGDRVKLQADLKIVFLGRIDTQVKHRGFRIELGEIESRLSSHPDVQASAVILANAGSDTARLEAFLVTRPGADHDIASINQLASQHLPAYMRPEQIHFLTADEMPRLPSGKINAKALHEVSSKKTAEHVALTQAGNGSQESLTDVDECEPITILLRTLASLFPGIGRIKPEADFFHDLGGHSLLAAQLVSRLRKIESHGDLPFASIGLPDVYEGRTPANIAARFTSFDDDQSSTLTESDYTGGLDGSGARTGNDVWPVSRTRFVLCGLAQIIPLIFIFFVNSIELLIPYLLFAFFVENSYSIGWALLASYGVFIAVPPCLFTLAVVGKWLILGRTREGEYPLYGLYYFRWWFAERLVSLANVKLIAGSGLYPFFLRALGTKVGNFCHLDSMITGATADLVEIGDDVVIGQDVAIATAIIERGRLILKRVVIQNDACIKSHSVVEGGAVIGDGAEVEALSMVADGMRIPGFQRWHGSPARFDRELLSGEIALGKQSRPSTPRVLAMNAGHVLISTFVLPLLFLVPTTPGLLLFNVVRLPSVGAWGLFAVLSLPITIAYQLLVFGQLILFRRLVMGKLKEGTYGIYGIWYLRKWFVDRLMELALAILHPVFATLYVVPFLRMLGVKIGHRAEVSNARGLNFELLEIGDESFVADLVMLGAASVRGNTLNLKKTKLGKRAFAGNVSVLPQGTILASDTLVGVLSIAPPSDRALAENTSCFGSPPVLMPARHRAQGHAETLLFKPSRGRIAARLAIEGMRIVLPRAILIFGLGLGLQIVHTSAHSIGIVFTLLMLPAFYFFLFALPALFITALLKWTLIGRYMPAEWPLWSLNVWLSEAVTSTYETVAGPLLTQLLVGTPYLAWCLRLLGARIGAKATLLSSGMTEFDCVSVGDEAVLNVLSGPQTHLFEDRIMKVGNITFGRRSCVKPYAICLPGSTVSENAQLGSLSLLMKGESLPEDTAWEGAPVRPRASRPRRPVGACKSQLPSSPMNCDSSATSCSGSIATEKKTADVDSAVSISSKVLD